VAVSLEAAFVLLDKASPALKDIRRNAIEADKALRGLGTGRAGLGGSSSSWTGGGSVTGYTQSITKAGDATKKTGNEVKKTADEVKKASGWFKRVTTDVKDWAKALDKTHPALANLASQLGGVVGGVKGLATALPTMAWAAIAAAAALGPLVGVIGALVSSLTFAVGGAGLLGGGLLGSFAVGIGSVIAVAKPALTGLKKYQAAVTALNKAMASGSTTQIRQRQKELDAIAKANPGVAQLAQNLTAFEKSWKKATAPGRASFFKLAADGIATLRKLTPTLASEVNKNTAAVEGGFRKILAPFLTGKTFQDMIKGFGGIFRANLPGVMRGIVNIITGLANALKVVTPELKKFGPWFADFTDKFAKWTESRRGRGQMNDMIRAFREWMRLLGGIGRLLGEIVSGGQKGGTSLVTKMADSVNKLADNLATPQGRKGTANYFSRALADADKLWPILQKLVDALSGIYKILKPVGSATTFILSKLPAGAFTALGAAFLGFKMLSPAIKGYKAVSGFFTGRDGSTPTKSLWVSLTGGGGGEGGGGGGSSRGKKGKLTAEEEQLAKEAEKKPGFFGRFFRRIPGVSKVSDFITGGKEGASLLSRIPGVGKITGFGSKAAGLFGKIPGLSKLGKVGEIAGKVGSHLPLLSLLAMGYGAAASPENASAAGRISGAAEMVDPTSLLSLIPGLGGFRGVAGSILHPLASSGGAGGVAAGALGGATIGGTLGTFVAPGLGTAIGAGIGGVAGGLGSLLFGSGPNRQQQQADQGLKSFGNRIKGVKDDLAELTPKQLQALRSWATQLANDKHLSKYRDQILDVRDALKNPTTGLPSALDKVAPAFDYMKRGAGKSLDAIQVMTNFAVQEIQKTLPAGSKAATDALAVNYSIAADDVKASMKDGVVKNTREGIAEVNRLMAEAFKQLGISPATAKKLAAQGWSLKAITSAGSSAQKSGLTGSGGGLTGSTVSGQSYQYAAGGRIPGRARGDHIPLYGRGGGLLGIADGGELVVNRHTESRINRKLAAYGTTLGKEVASETKPHYQTGSYAHGGRVQGYQTGGVVGQINALASAAGFNRIAIAGLLGNAMQESSLNPNTPGGGLWQQISNFGQGTGGSVAQQWARMLPQITGLRAAMNAAGTPGAAATIFEQGFEKAGIPALANRIRYANAAFAGKLGKITGGGGGGGGVSIPLLRPPNVGGQAFQHALGQATVNQYTGAANYVLQRVAASMGGGGGGIGMGGAIPRGAAGTVMDPSGKPVAGWIEPILAWARTHGWSGTVTSGYRSYAQQAAIYNSGVRPAAVPGTSNHEGTVYPRGAVDVSNASGLSRVLLSGPYGSTLVWAGAKDPVHFSHPHGGSYGLGGRVPWFAGGADFIASRPQLIGVGDRPGGERVQVTPAGGRTGGGGHHIEIHKIEVNRKGDIQRIVDEELRLLADSLDRQS
jgi:hypothetical protein